MLTHRTSLVVALTAEQVHLAHPKERRGANDAPNVNVAGQVQANDLNLVGNGRRVKVCKGLDAKVAQGVLDIVLGSCFA